MRVIWPHGCEAVDTATLAKILGVSENIINNHRRSGKLPSIRISNEVHLYQFSDMLEMFRNLAVNRQEESFDRWGNNVGVPIPALTDTVIHPDEAEDRTEAEIAKKKRTRKRKEATPDPNLIAALEVVNPPETVAVGDLTIEYPTPMEADQAGWDVAVNPPTEPAPEPKPLPDAPPF